MNEKPSVVEYATKEVGEVIRRIQAVAWVLLKSNANVVSRPDGLTTRINPRKK